MLEPPPDDQQTDPTTGNEETTGPQQSAPQASVNQPEAQDKRQRSHWAKAAAFGFSIEAVLAAVALLLALAGLAGIEPTLFASIAVIFVAAALLVASRFRRFAAKARTRETGMAEVGAISIEYLAGGPAMILGVLAVVGIVPLVLATVALLLFGLMLMFGATEAGRQANISTLYPPPHPPAPQTLRILEWVTGTQMLAGIAAVILAVMSLVGMRPRTLVLFGLLVISIAQMLGSATVVWRMRKAS